MTLLEFRERTGGFPADAEVTFDIEYQLNTNQLIVRNECVCCKDEATHCIECACEVTRNG